MHHGEILSRFKVNFGGSIHERILINFLVIPRSDYLKGMRKLLIVMQKSEVIYTVEHCLKYPGYKSIYPI